MIDKIHLHKSALSESQILTILDKNKLIKYTENGEVFYRNFKEAKFYGGLSIEITTKKELNVRVSVHKYYNYLTQKKTENYTPFSMYQAQETIYKILFQLGISIENIQVKMYEVGLNIILPVDVKTILNKVQSIQTQQLKKIYINPKYKDERAIYTEFYKDIRTHYKLYDKVQEMKDRKAQPLPQEYILRVETSRNRPEKLSLQKFLSLLPNEQKVFLKDWSGLLFEKEVKAPKGTNYIKKEFAKKVNELGWEVVKEMVGNDHKNKTITRRQFRTLTDFLNSWETEKNNYQFEPCTEENIFKKAMKKAVKIIAKMETERVKEILK